MCENTRLEANSLISAVGFGTEPIGLAAAAAKAGKPAFRYYEKESLDVERTLGFEDAHKNAARLAASLRTAAHFSGALGERNPTVGLLLSRTAALPLSQLAAFKGGVTFVPLDVREEPLTTIRA